MGNYIKRQYSQSGEVQKSQEVRVVEKVVEKEVDIDILAQAVAKALVNYLPNVNNIPNVNNVQNNQNDQNKKDTFDESKTLENIAKSMLINRNEKESNINDISKNIVEIKKDNKETNNTINLLSDLDD